MIPDAVLYPNSNVVLNIAEKAVVGAIQSEIYPYQVDVRASDENEVKPPMPYITVHASDYQEDIGPGTGIFKMRVTATFRSHVKPDDINFRTAVCQGINNFLYRNPAVELSNTDGFHCYGFIPGATGSMAVNPELKAYEYLVSMDLFCMPRNNE